MVPNPLALIAELTHRCPLHCVYCSNPLELAAVTSELSTAEWNDIFQQSGKLGMLHAHFTGGEPLARPDLTELVAGARAAGLYTNLITSGIGLTETRLHALVDAGLDHIQISFQDSREGAANWIAGAKAHAHKIELSRLVRRHKIAFTVNLVIHRQNIDHLEEMISFIEKLAPDRMEIAHTQYYGWALKNRAALLPTREQLDRAVEAVSAAEKRLAGRIRIDFVVPDYYARFPKACMGGWGRRLMLINPSGKVLPCHAAEVIPGLTFENVREQTLESHLAGFFVIPAFSRRRMDARTMPQLRSPHRGFRRMPLPGPAACRRCHAQPIPSAPWLPRITSSSPRSPKRIPAPPSPSLFRLPHSCSYSSAPANSGATARIRNKTRLRQATPVTSARQA